MLTEPRKQKGETSSVAAVRLFSAFGGLTAERLEAGLCAANRKR